MKRTIVVVLASFGLFILGACGGGGGGDDGGNGSEGFVGSEWDFTITQSHNYTVESVPIGSPCLDRESSMACSNFGPSVTTFVGRFKITDSELDYDGSGEYALELLSNNISVKFEHNNWRDNNTTCTSYSDETDLTSFLNEFNGTYYSYPDQGERFEISWDHTGNSIDHSFASDCVAPFDPFLGGPYYWTEYYWPYHWFNSFSMDARDYVKDYQEEPFLLEIITTRIHITCTSGCEPEEDPCDEDTIYNSCDEFKESVKEFCQTLDDWMIVSSRGDSDTTEVVCATADCSGPISRNKSQDPWVGVTYHYDSMCSQNPDDIVCQVECYGWAQGSE